VALGRAEQLVSAARLEDEPLTVFLADTLGWRFLLSLVLSITLWARLTLDQNPQRVDVYPTEIPVEARGLPANLVVANELPTVRVKVSAPQESWRFLEPSSFRVSVNLDQAGAGIVQPEVTVETPDPNVRVLEITPAKVSLRVEELRTVEVPVQVNQAGSTPFGFRIGDPLIVPPRVQISGPSSAVERVNVAQVTLRLDEARSTIDRSLKPEPRGPNGVVSGVRVEPQNVTVTLPVEQIAGSKAVSIVPRIIGQPAAGYWQGPITVDPGTVQVVAEPSVLDTVSLLSTADIDITGAQAEIVRSVAVQRPAGVALVRDQPVTVRISVLPLQGQQVRDLNVTVANVADGLSVAVSPAAINVTITGPQPTLLRLTPDVIGATVDATGLGSGQHTLPVQVQAPEGLRADRLLPSDVTLVLAPRQTASATPTVSAGP